MVLPDTHTSRTVLWLSVLFAAVLVAITATVLDNRIKNTHRSRAHNSILLFNECLAEHQSSYVLYFIALLSTTEFSVFWVKPALQSSVVLGLLCYVVGISITADHELNVTDDHTCDSARCRKKLPWGTRFRIIAFNLIASTILMGISILFAWFAVKPPSS